MKNKFIFAFIISMSIFLNSCIVARTGPPHPHRPKRHRAIIVGSNYELIPNDTAIASTQYSIGKIQEAY